MLTALHTDDQAALHDLVSSFAQRHGAVRDPRAVLDGPVVYDPANWRVFADQTGLPGVLVPERFGGLGLSVVEAGLVAAGLANNLVALPFFGTSVLTASVLLELPDDAAAPWLTRIASGTRAAFAFAERGTGWLPTVPTTTATSHDGRWRLNGTKTAVMDADGAAFVLVLACTNDGPAVFVVEPGGAEVQCRPRSTVDLTRQYAEITLSDAAADLLTRDADVVDRVLTALRSSVAVLAAEQAAGAAATLRLATDYARQRKQFGKPIGAFQAIKHICARMYVQVQTAQAAADSALAMIAANAPERSLAAHVAQAHCGAAFVQVATDSIQVHGGIGVTWEHPAHLYFRRARMDEFVFGSGAFHRRAVRGLVAL